MSETAANARYDSVFRPGLFQGRVICVTGGGSGIGRCIAHELAALGAHVVLIGRKPDKLDTVEAEIGEDGGAAETRAFDIRDEEAVNANIAEIAAKHGRIDALVNNAGGQFPAEVADISKK
ncbi:MAG: SDR family NAD(P)-dependent oxidoreductase, partial [Oceanicaulis sp.]